MKMFYAIYFRDYVQHNYNNKVMSISARLIQVMSINARLIQVQSEDPMISSVTRWDNRP